MNRTIVYYIIIFFGLMIFFVLNDLSKEKIIDWTPSFDSADKNPYGLFVFVHEIKELFKNSEIKYAAQTPYEYIDSIQISNIKKSYYVFIDNEVHFDKQSLHKILNFVKNGNGVFISSYQLPKELSDTLKFEIELKTSPVIKDEDQNFPKLEILEPNVILYFSDVNWDSTKYLYNKGIENYYFKEIDTSQTRVLGFQHFNNISKPNLINIKFGKGNFMIHTQPFVFTNFNLLKTKNQNYVSNVMSFIPDSTIIIDSRNSTYNYRINSPLRFIMSQKILRWTWFLMLFSLVLFVIFRAKRTQRIIPIIEKLPNTSLDFAKTIGNLYHQQGKPKEIVFKKINFFLEFVRNNYLLDTQNLNEDFSRKLHYKSGISLLEIERLVQFILKMKITEPTENDLIFINKMISEFYKNPLKK